MIMAQDRPFVQPSSETWDGGYQLYMRRMPITVCGSLQAARGWLAAQYGEDAALAAECGVTCIATPPSRLSAEDVAGIIAQAEDIAERVEAEYRRMGY